MIIFVTTPSHEQTVRFFVDNKFKLDMPRTVAWNYDQLFRAERVPAATFIFADLERLYPWEARLAGVAFQSLRSAGLRCLNDPARVLTRFQLLRALHEAGINPFNVYRADDDPQPKRFPVFIRSEQEHGITFGDLLASREALDAQLTALVEAGIGLAGLMVVEFCGEPVAPGIWRRFGTMKIGDRLHVNHHVTQNSWMVRTGTPGLCPDWLYGIEYETVVQNRYPAAVSEAFRIANVDYGRADHGSFDGRDIVFEINTNPNVGTRRHQPSPIRNRTIAHSRCILARDLRAVDSGDGSPVEVPATAELSSFRQRPGAGISAWRP